MFNLPKVSSTPTTLFKASVLATVLSFGLSFSLTACMGTSNSSYNGDTSPHNQISAQADVAWDYATLEVVSVYGESDGDSVELISLDGTMKFRTILSIPNLGDNYISLKQGDRVKIVGDYAESYPVQIMNITAITKVANPDKAQCEANGNVWRPEGKAQIPACVEQYSDGGKACTSSTDCEGECMVTNENQSAQCASDNSRFGCGSSIEDFNKHGGIICVD